MMGLADMDPDNPWYYCNALGFQPHAKKRPRISAPRVGARPRTHQDPADKAAEERTENAVIGWMIRNGVPQFTGNVELRMVFFRQTRQVVDWDNLVKHLLDSLNGVLWADDSQITKTDVELHLDRHRPRTEFAIRRHIGATMLRGTDAK